MRKGKSNATPAKRWMALTLALSMTFNFGGTWSLAEEPGELIAADNQESDGGEPIDFLKDGVIICSTGNAVEVNHTTIRLGEARTGEAMGLEIANPLSGNTALAEETLADALSHSTDKLNCFIWKSPQVWDVTTDGSAPDFRYYIAPFTSVEAAKAYVQECSDTGAEIVTDASLLTFQTQTKTDGTVQYIRNWDKTKGIKIMNLAQFIGAGDENTEVSLPYPKWENGITISTWVKASSDQPAPVFVFQDRDEEANYGNNNMYGGLAFYTDGTILYQQDDPGSKQGNGAKRNSFGAVYASEDSPANHVGEWVHVSVSIKNAGFSVFYNGKKTEVTSNKVAGMDYSLGKSKTQFFNYSYGPDYEGDGTGADNFSNDMVLSWEEQRLTPWGTELDPEYVQTAFDMLLNGKDYAGGSSVNIMEYVTSPSTRLFLGGDDGKCYHWLIANNLCDDKYAGFNYTKASEGMMIAGMHIETNPIADEAGAELIYQNSQKDVEENPVLEKPKVTVNPVVTPVITLKPSSAPSTTGTPMITSRPTGVLKLGEVVDFSDKRNIFDETGNSAEFDGTRIKLGEATSGAAMGVEIANPLSGNTALTEETLADALSRSVDKLNCFIWKSPQVWDVPTDGSTPDFRYYIAPFASVEAAKAYVQECSDTGAEIVTDASQLTFPTQTKTDGTVQYIRNWEKTKGIKIMNLAQFIGAGDENTEVSLPYPKWENGITISTWVKASSDQPAPVFVFQDRDEDMNYGNNNMYGGLAFFTDGTVLYQQDDVNDKRVGNGIRRNSFGAVYASEDSPANHVGEWVQVTVTIKNAGFSVSYNGKKAEVTSNKVAGMDYGIGKVATQFFNYSYGPDYEGDGTGADNFGNDTVLSWEAQRLKPWGTELDPEYVQTAFDMLLEGKDDGAVNSMNIMEYVTSPSTRLFLGGDDGKCNQWLVANNMVATGYTGFNYTAASEGMEIKDLCISSLIVSGASDETNPPESMTPSVTKAPLDFSAYADEFYITEDGILRQYKGQGGTVVIPDGVSAIGDEAFSYCGNVTEVTIPSSVTKIGRSAFLSCSGLKTVVLSEGLQKIRDSAFFGCSNLTSLNIPASVEEIESHVFSACGALESIQVAEGNAKYDSRNNCNAIIKTETNKLIVGCRNTVIPEGVTEIGSMAFYGCKGLTEITIPEGVTTIADGAFESCTDLKKVVIPRSATEIAYAAFGYETDFLVIAGYFGSYAYEYARDYGIEFLDVELPDFSAYADEFEIDGKGFITSYKGSGGAVVIPDGIHGIGESAFEDTNITEVTIPSSVVEIGNYAFDSCAGLTSIIIPEGVNKIGSRAFSYCKNLTNVDLPSSITTIDHFAFYYCSSLTNLVIPANVTYIGPGAFGGCNSLESIRVEDGNTVYDSRKDCNAVIDTVRNSLILGCKNSIIPEGVTRIESDAFYHCESLTEVAFPSSLTVIEYAAFQGCTGLTEIIIPSGVTEIGSAAFDNCSSLKNVVLSEGLNVIGSNAFFGCGSLTSFHVPASVSNIDFAVIASCVSMESISVAEGNTVYDSRNDCNGIVETARNKLIAGCKNTVIPEGVVTIGESAFRGCPGLAEFVIPEGVTEIEDYAFRECSNLEKITIPKSVTSISGNAFDYGYFERKLTIVGYVDSYAYEHARYHGYNFIDIELPDFSAYADEFEIDGIGCLIDYKGTGGDVVIPEGVRTIASRAFDGEKDVTSITIPDSVKEIHSYAFSGCDGITELVIPKNVNSIGTKILNHCDNLTSLRVSEENETYDSRDNCNAIIEKETNKLIVGTNRSMIPSTITSIGDYAFEGCRTMAAVEVPEGVTAIGYGAFFRCEGLAEVNLPDSLVSLGASAFSFCSRIKSVRIPSKVTQIGTGAFTYCDELESLSVAEENERYDSRDNCNGIVFTENNVLIAGCKNTVIPENVTMIGNSAFEGCIGLTEILIPENVTKIGSNAFSGCGGLTEVVIPEGVANIGKFAFDSCSSLKKVTIPRSVTYISGYLFGSLHDDNPSIVGYMDSYAYDYARYRGYDFIDIELPDFSAYADEFEIDGMGCLTGYKGDGGAVVIPEGVRSIGSSAFSYEESITSIAIPDSVKEIGSYAFSGCNGLTELVIPKNVASIGVGVIKDCGNLAVVRVSEENETYDSRDNCNAIVEKQNNTLIAGNHYSIIPATVTSIGESAFAGCRTLAAVEIPESVTDIAPFAFENSGLTSIAFSEKLENIGYDAFYGCCNLTSVTIPGSVKTVGAGAFSGCTSMASVEIQEGVTTIENGAFRSCFSLTDVSIANSVKTLGEEVFYNCDSLNRIAIPAGVEDIGARIFSYCTSLESISVSEENTKYDSRKDCNAIIETESNKLVVGCAKTVIPEDVLSIGDYAFYNCTSLTEYVIPEGVTEIGYQAFLNGYNLRRITIPRSVISIDDAFNHSYWWNSYDLEIVGYLDSYAYEYAMSNGYAFRDILLPDFSAYADEFEIDGMGCLTNYKGDGGDVVIPEGVRSIGSYAFDYEDGITSITIPNSVTSIGRAAFKACSGLTSITIPDSVESIDSYAFSECSGLTSITIPGSVERVAAFAFNECSALTEVVLSEGVLYIGDCAFLDCAALTSFQLPASVTYVGRGILSGCDSLTSITVSEQNETYDSRDNCNAIIEKENNKLIAGCGTSSIPNDVEIIGSLAFQDCVGLTAIVISGTITKIEADAFSGCDVESITVSEDNKVYDSRDNCNALIETETNRLILGCKNSVIPATVTRIDDSAFRNVKGLKHLAVPDGVTSIGSYAFMACEDLELIDIPASVVSMGYDVFDDCLHVTIRGEKGSYAYEYAVGNRIAFSDVRYLTHTGKEYEKAKILDDKAYVAVGTESVDLSYGFDYGLAYDGSKVTVTSIKISSAFEEFLSGCGGTAKLELHEEAGYVSLRGSVTGLNEEGEETWVRYSGSLFTVMLEGKTTEIEDLANANYGLLWDTQTISDRDLAEGQTLLDFAQTNQYHCFRATLESKKILNATIEDNQVKVELVVDSADWSQGFDYGLAYDRSKVDYVGLNMDEECSNFINNRQGIWTHCDFRVTGYCVVGGVITDGDRYGNPLSGIYTGRVVTVYFKPASDTVDLTTAEFSVVDDSATISKYHLNAGQSMLDYAKACGYPLVTGTVVVPAPGPTVTPTRTPAAVETEAPTTAPTEAPTTAPTTAPTEAPTTAPTEAPTTVPTEAPTTAPTEAPTMAPTEAPTMAPTEAPTTAPTEAPTTAPTEAPTTAPTETPTTAPTEAPTTAPTEAPTTAPTETPTTAPTEAPTTAPTEAPIETVAPIPVEPDQVVTVDQVVEQITEIIKDAVEKVVEIVSNAPTTITKDVFTNVIEAAKDLTVGVADENNNLKYQWTFETKKFRDVPEALDLTIDYVDEGEILDNVVTAAGTNDVLCMDFKYKEELPGTAKIKSYVGEKFEDGKNLYLYKLVGDKVEKVEAAEVPSLQVTDGYVEFAVDSGATYFLSPTLIEGAEVSTVVEETTKLGDMDRSGKIELTDVVTILRAALGIIDVTGVDKVAADVNEDGKVNLTDAQISLKMALGIL